MLDATTGFHGGMSLQARRASKSTGRKNGWDWQRTRGYGKNNILTHVDKRKTYFHFTRVTGAASEAS